MTLDEARKILNAKWESRSLRVDWLALEQFQRDILGSEYILGPHLKIALIAEALAAWTRRGTPSISGSV